MHEWFARFFLAALFFLAGMVAGSEIERQREPHFVLIGNTFQPDAETSIEISHLGCSIQEQAE